VEALGKIIIGGPYPPSNAIIYMDVQIIIIITKYIYIFVEALSCGGPWATAQFAPPP